MAWGADPVPVKTNTASGFFCDGLASAGACGRKKPTGCLTKNRFCESGTAYRLTHVCLETCRENADDDDDVVVKGALLILIIQTVIIFTNARFVRTVSHDIFRYRHRLQ